MSGSGKKGMKKHLVADAVHYQRARKRRGTMKLKTRAERSGGGAKPWRQKGTGRARQGSIRVPHWTGGGRVKGTARKSYNLKMNAKARRAALASLLEDAVECGMIIREHLDFETPSTRKFVRFLEEKGLKGKILVLHDRGYSPNVLKSMRNVPGVRCLRSSCINCHDLLNADWILIPPEDGHIVDSRTAKTG
ncbi:MAG: 50S ribosomal protein L4 [bacterium]